MNVCIVTDTMPGSVGGLTTYYKHLIRLLASHNINVIVLQTGKTPSNELNVTYFDLQESYEKYYKQFSKYFRKGGLDAPSWISRGLSARAWLIENHKKYFIDIVEVPDYGGIGAFLKIPGGPALVVGGHGMLNQLAAWNFVASNGHENCIQALESMAIKFADAVIAHSPSNQGSLSQKFSRNILFAKIPWYPSKPDLQTNGKENIVVGGLQRVKGAETVLQALKILENANENIKIFWTGPDTYTAPGNQSMGMYLMKKYPALWMNNFIWENELSFSETQQRIASAKIVVIPAQWESFNYVSLEAAANAKPIIMTSSTGASYLFTHQHDALIIPPNDPVALATSISLLNEKIEVWERLGMNAKKMVEIVFNPSEIIADRIKAYKTAIENKSEIQIPYEQLTKQYLTPARKLYYHARQLAKNIFKPAH